MRAARFHTSDSAMDRFKELTTFVEVAQRGSLSAAAREEGITPAMVGRRIDQLEERLGVKLFKRSTRKVTLTPEGTTFYEDCHRLLDELRAAEDALSRRREERLGTAHRHRAHRRSAASTSRRTSPRSSPSIRTSHITLHLSERLVDLKNERFDLAIRIADLKSADLIAAKLARNHRVVCGSPAYFKRAGKPKAARRPRQAQLPRDQHRGRRRRHLELPGQGQARGVKVGGQPAVQRRRGAHALGDRRRRASRGAAPGR